MNLVQDFFHTVYNVPELIRIVGQFGLPVIVFAETGLLIGFFLPGDSLLITAGLFAARGDLNLSLLIVTLIPGGHPRQRDGLSDRQADRARRSTAGRIRCCSGANTCR